MELWPHQTQAIKDILMELRTGVKSLVVAAPTGAGKSRIISEIASRAAEKDSSVLLLTNRKILIDQLSKELSSQGVCHGVIASGRKESMLHDMHLAMAQTLYSWAWDSDYMKKPTPNLVLVDELHSHQAPQSQEIINHAKDNGATIIGFTATPCGLGSTVEAMVQAGSYSMLQKAGILVPVEVFSPSEISMEGIAKAKGEYSQKQAADRARECGVFGDIYEHWKILNPLQKPTAVFAPDVASSKWIVKNVFEANGVPACHIDGETPEDERLEVFARLESGDIRVISSCGVLREGWNCPCVQHAILLQMCGRLLTFLQIAGRIMRAFEGKTFATLQDHTGAFWRHGPPDKDQDWVLNEDDSYYQERRLKNIDDGKYPKAYAARSAVMFVFVGQSALNVDISI